MQVFNVYDRTDFFDTRGALIKIVKKNPEDRTSRNIYGRRGTFVKSDIVLIPMYLYTYI